MPIIKTSQAIKEVPVGGILEVLTTDPGSDPDLTSWAKMTGNVIIGTNVDDSHGKVFRFRIRRLK